MLFNVTGMQYFKTVLKSDVLLIDKSHRIRNLSTWQNKWNGGDVSSIIPYLTSIWFFVIKIEHLNDQFWSHRDSLIQI
jgi:hypothetical protein